MRWGRMACEGWGVGAATYFSLTTLGMGGITNLGTGPDGLIPELHAWLLVRLPAPANPPSTKDYVS